MRQLKSLGFTTCHSKPCSLAFNVDMLLFSQTTTVPLFAGFFTWHSHCDRPCCRCVNEITSLWCWCQPLMNAQGSHPSRDRLDSSRDRFLPCAACVGAACAGIFSSADSGSRGRSTDNCSGSSSHSGCAMFVDSGSTESSRGIRKSCPQRQSHCFCEACSHLGARSTFSDHISLGPH
jgi:hypothetical protein